MKAEKTIAALTLRKFLIIDKINATSLPKIKNKLFEDLGRLEFRISLARKEDLGKVKNIFD